MPQTDPSGPTEGPDDEQGGADVDRPSRSDAVSVAEIEATYDEKAEQVARWQWLDRLFAGRYRGRQFAGASGRVLDVACGTGPNFRYLTDASEIVGVDLSAAMLAQARAELDRLDRSGRVQRMDAQRLAFPDDAFDTVVSSFSTCTFPDPVAAVREMARVCDPDGRLLLLEHGQSDAAPLAKLLDWRAPAHYEKSGCRLTQEPLAHVREADLSVERSETALFGVLTAIEARPGET
ncbi:class I SAM-dependent methyltransferase [Halorientalis halophila]|uniref:class I SAM-dependent methyltransferase n=1 Tax=Halorientalis halophila TaxID=3108499 RepID=UPI0030094110